MPSKDTLSMTNLLGGVAGAFSLFSLLENLFQFGIASMFVDIVEYYRALGDWLFGWVFLPFDVDLPGWLRDLWCLSFIVCGMKYREESLIRASGLSTPRFRYIYSGSNAFGSIIKVIVRGFSLASFASIFGMLLQISAKQVPEDLPNNKPETIRLYNFMIASSKRVVVSTLVALIIFFALNAYGLSVS